MSAFDVDFYFLTFGWKTIQSFNAIIKLKDVIFGLYEFIRFVIGEFSFRYPCSEKGNTEDLLY